MFKEFVFETDQEILKEALNDESKSVCVTFTKSDGSNRVLRCTTAATRIPDDQKPKGTGGVASTSTHRVFDTEACGWKSFKWESVISFEIN